MAIHFLLLFLAFCTFLFAVDKNQFKKGIFFSAILFWIVAYILVTFRAENIGNDTPAYIVYFQDCLLYDSLHDYLEFGSGRFEKGFAILSFLCSRVSGNFTVFFAFCNLLYFAVTMRFFRYFSVNKNAWILPWFLAGMYYNLFNTLRSCMAIIFIYLFILDFMQNKKIKSLMWFGVAVSMHISALTAGIVFLTKSSKMRKIFSHEIILLTVFGLIGIMFAQFMTLLPNYYSDYYFESEYGQGPTRIASMVDLAFLGGLYILSRVRKIATWEHHDLFKILFLNAIGMSFLGLFLPSFNRVEFLFIPFALIYIINTFKYHTGWKKLMIVLMFSALTVYQIVAFLIRPEWLGIFPYTFK